MSRTHEPSAPQTTMEAMDAAGREFRYLFREVARSVGVYKALDLLEKFLSRFSRFSR